jgi:hypothetical protein
MKSMQIDDNGDPVVKNGSIQFVYDIYAVMQAARQVMKAQVGEYQYDQTKGIEYFGNVFTGTPNLQRFEAQARSQLLALEGVEKINDFEYSLDSGELEYSIEIQTTYGTGTVASAEGS